MSTNVEYILSLKDRFSEGIDKADKGANKLQRTMSGLKGGMSSLTSGLMMGAGIGIFEQLSGAVVNFAQNSIAEYEGMIKVTNELKRTLQSVGRQDYYTSLIQESNTLADAFHNLYDNDDIIVAQTQLINYGKVTRGEMSKLLPVIADLSAKEGIDLTQATEKVINIMAGRGGQTLRQYGLSVKGVGTEHDRLNLILGEFQQKLKGSVDVYSTTAQGIEQTNKVMLANIEENFGRSFTNIKMKVMPIITQIFDGISLIMESKEDIRTRKMGDLSTKMTGIYGKLTPEKIKEEERNLYERAKSLAYVQDAISKDEIRRIEVNNGKRNIFEYSEITARLKKNKELLERGTYEITAKKNALNELKLQGNNKVFNPNASNETEKVGIPPPNNSKTTTMPRNMARSQATGSKSVTINVSIKDLIGTNNMNITNVKESINKIQDMVVGALTGAVNDFQLIAE